MFVECSDASRFLQKVYQGDMPKLVTILNAEADDDFVTLKHELLLLQSEIGKLIVNLGKAQKKALG